MYDPHAAGKERGQATARVCYFCLILLRFLFLPFNKEKRRIPSQVGCVIQVTVYDCVTETAARLIPKEHTV